LVNLKLSTTISYYKKEPYKEIPGYFDCFSDLLIFFEFVKENNFDLRVSRP